MLWSTHWAAAGIVVLQAMENQPLETFISAGKWQIRGHAQPSVLSSSEIESMTVDELSAEVKSLQDQFEIQAREVPHRLLAYI